jgi:uncharacterized phage-associated protein
MPLPNSTIAIANAFIKLAVADKIPLNSLALAKLVHLANGFHLGAYGVPMTDEPTIAAPYGPIHPRLFDATRKYRGRVISEPLRTWLVLEPAISSKQHAEIIEAVWAAHKHLTDVQLSSHCHAEGTPWADLYHARANEGRPIVGRYEENLCEWPSIDEYRLARHFAAKLAEA